MPEDIKKVYKLVWRKKYNKLRDENALWQQKSAYLKSFGLQQTKVEKS